MPREIGLVFQWQSEAQDLVGTSRAFKPVWCFLKLNQKVLNLLQRPFKAVQIPQQSLGEESGLASASSTLCRAQPFPSPSSSSFV